MAWCDGTKNKPDRVLEMCVWITKTIQHKGKYDRVYTVY